MGILLRLSPSEGHHMPIISVVGASFLVVFGLKYGFMSQAVFTLNLVYDYLKTKSEHKVNKIIKTIKEIRTQYPTISTKIQQKTQQDYQCVY